MKSNSKKKKNKQDGEITPKLRKPELSLLYATRHLVLFYISTTCHQNMPKGIPVTEQTRNQIQTQEGEITHFCWHSCT